MCRESIECMKRQPRGGGKGAKGRMCWPEMLYKSEEYRIETLTKLGVINATTETTTDGGGGGGGGGGVGIQ